MYLVDDALHRSLLTRDPTFTFTIANSLTEGPTVDIVLPYSSFDLGYLPSFDTPTLRYFPIQPAANDTQLTLGRAFLQEAYVTTDYQQGNFSVSQCNFEESLGQIIRPILPLGSNISTTSPQSDSTSIPNAKHPDSHLTDRQLAGIISGAISGAFLLLAILYWFHRRWCSRRRQGSRPAAPVASTGAAEQVSEPLQFFEKFSELEPVPGVPEMAADPLYMNQELPGDGRAEIQRRGMPLGLLRSIRSLTPTSQSRPRSSIAMLRRDWRRYGRRFSTSDLLFTGNVLRYLAKLNALNDSRSTTPANRESVSTVAQVNQLHLDDSLPEEAQSPSPAQPRTRPVTARLTQLDLNRPLPPTPIFESPQRFSHLAWMRIGARYNEEQIRRETQYSHPPEMSQWTRTTQDQMGWF
ncbi:MAG: hypothetical protein LQ350_008176 [Teloschistes chrysophthalmus]|nr:MAG: hypothetical protein LQ350_008176 [Niorma chrysophthalma]